MSAKTPLNQYRLRSNPITEDEKEEEEERLEEETSSSNESFGSGHSTLYYLPATQPFNMGSKIDMPCFTGAAGTSAQQWFKSFNDYAEIIGLDDQRKAKLLRFYLKDHALAYYDSLVEDLKNNFDAVQDDMTDRFSEDHNDMDLLSLHQRQGEDSASFFTRVLKVTNNGYPESLLVSIVLKGLKPEVRQIVMPQNKQTVEEVRKAALLAERTLASANPVNVAAAFTDIVTQQIQGLAEKIANIEVNQMPTWRRQTTREQHPRQQQYQPPQPRRALQSTQGQTMGCHRCGEVGKIGAYVQDQIYKRLSRHTAKYKLQFQNNLSSHSPDTSFRTQM